MKNTTVVVFLFTTMIIFCSQEEKNVERLKISQRSETRQTVQNETTYNNSQRMSPSRRPDPNIERVRKQASYLREPRDPAFQ